MSTESVHGGLTAYSEYIARYKDKPSNRPQQTSIRLLREHEANYTLDKLNKDKIEIWLAYWCGRPKSKNDNDTLAYTTCRNALIVLRQFLRWLSGSDAFEWLMPPGFSFPRCKIIRTPEDRENKRKRKHFKREELLTIWRYAKSWDRALIILALNCGFSKREIATLQKSEIEKGEKYTFIKRERWKTEVYAEWVLWPETLEALEYLKLYQTAGNPFVVLHSRKGDMTHGTKKENENQVIKNHWDRIMG